MPVYFLQTYPLAYAYSHRYLTLEFDEHLFDEIYNEYVLYVEQKKFIYRTVCYLPNVIVETILNLPDGFSIKPVNDMYLNYLLSVDPFFRDSLNNTSLERVLNGMIMPYDASILLHEFIDGPAYDVNELRSKVDAVLKSLVLNNGVSHSFDIRPVYTYSYFNSSSLTMYFPELTIHKNIAQAQRIHLSSSNEISTYYSLLRKLGDNLPLAVSRFLSAFTKASDDDKFIDLVIALESLYPSVKAENNFRISILTAFALHQGHDMFIKVKNIYDYRSGLVHGDSRKPKVTLKEACVIIKKTLRFFLEEMTRGKSLKQIEDDLMLSILGNKMIPENFFE